MGAALGACCPSRTSNWSRPPAAGPCCCRRRAPRPTGPRRGADEVVAVLDGLVLTGGGDVDPLAYGEEPRPEVGGVDTDARRERAGPAGGGAAGRPARARHLPGLPGPQRGARRHAAPAPARRDRHTWRTAAAPLVFGEVEVETVPGLEAADVFGPAHGRPVLAPPGHRRPRAGAGHRPPPRPTASSRRSSSRRRASSSACSGTPRSGRTSGRSTRWSRRPTAYAAGAVGAPQRVNGRRQRPGRRRHRGEPGARCRAGGALRRRRACTSGCAHGTRRRWPFARGPRRRTGMSSGRDAGPGRGRRDRPGRARALRRRRRRPGSAASTCG